MKGNEQETGPGKSHVAGPCAPTTGRSGTPATNPTGAEKKSVKPPKLQTQCKHTSLVIYEQVAGKKSFRDKPFEAFIDWTANIINAHYLRVTKYYCTNCKEIIPAPSDAKDD